MAGSSSPRRATSDFGSDSRGQSETIAVVLIIAITVVGTSAVVVLGSAALSETQESSHVQNTEHAMTLFDSRSAMVALGDSSGQSVDLGSAGAGTYEIRDTGWIRVEHTNFTGAEEQEDVRNETIYNASLGSVVYENGGTTIAYEGGGVWRKEDGGTSMVSPPEFHYRGATLTLPIIRVEGANGAAGNVNAGIEPAAETRRVFPNRTDSTDDGVGAPYDDTDDSPYANPVNDGKINVTVQSDYYEGWADYFRTRTDGTVSVNHANQTATVQLVTFATDANFEMPAESNSVKVIAMDDNGHPLHDFNVTLTAEKTTNFHFSFWAESGNKEFEVHLYSHKLCDEELDVSVYYYNGTGGTYQGWQNSNIDVSENDAFSVDCGGQGGNSATLTADFMYPTTDMEYKEIDLTGSDNKWRFGSEMQNREIAASTTFDQHSAVTGEPKIYDTNSGYEDLDFLMGHYFSLMGPDVDLTVSEGPGGSDRVDEGASFGRLEYDQTGTRYITFMHITENRVRVEFE